MAKKKSTTKKKGAAKKSPAKKKPGGASAKALAPKPVKTGKGLSPMEVGNAVMRQINAGDWEPNKQLWSPKVVSIEGVGVSMAWHGKKAIDAKNAQWYAEHEMVGGSADGPFVGATGFSIKFNLEVKKRATGEVLKMSEVGVYTVQNGKIVREEFMYGMH